MNLSRRNVLQLFAAATAATFVRRGFASTPTQLTSWTPAAGWGTYGNPRKVLEIYLRGGASFWGSFWYDTTLGGASGTGDTALTSSDWSAIAGASAVSTQAWNSSTLGEATSPLFKTKLTGGTARKLADYMRVVRVGHWLPPHEAAIPYAATGTTLGRPHQAGLGAAIWRQAAAQPNAAGGVQSLVLQTGTMGNDDSTSRYLASTGRHGAGFASPIIKLGNTDFFNALSRTNLSGTDGFKSFYRNRYEALLTQQNATAAVRSDGWSAYAASLDTMTSYADDLQILLSPTSIYSSLFTTIANPTYQSNYTRNAISTAVSLLAASGSILGHVAVVDGGVEYNYDTHNATGSSTVAKIQCGNLWNVCDALYANIDAILNSGIVVLLHSEFGRMETEANDGTEHHPEGYANVVISDMLAGKTGFTGDAVDPDSSLSAKYPLSEASFSGAASGHPKGLTPTDVHAAVLSLAGIEPWQADVHVDDINLSCTNDGTTGNDSANKVLTIA